MSEQHVRDRIAKLEDYKLERLANKMIQIGLSHHKQDAKDIAAKLLSMITEEQNKRFNAVKAEADKIIALLKERRSNDA